MTRKIQSIRIHLGTQELNQSNDKKIFNFIEKYHIQVIIQSIRDNMYFFLTKAYRWFGIGRTI